MPVEVILPKVDMDMETGTISAWHVVVGDTVAQGDPLFDIETDKAAMEVESPANGVLQHVIAREGETVPIGRTVAWIFADGEQVPDAPPKSDTHQSVSIEPVTPVSSVAPVPDTRAPVVTDKMRATPAARKLAREADLALVDIPGTGPQARIQSSDVRSMMNTVLP
ncbi:unnamed protein product, partial [Ectocarpus sp. 12 AP-2014]